MKTISQNMQYNKRINGNIANMILTIASLILFVLLFKSIFVWLYTRWTSSDSYYSHGCLIAPISIFIFLRERIRSGNLSTIISIEALPIFGMIFSLLIFICSGYFRIYFISGISMVLFLMFTGWFTLGYKVFKEYKFAFLYLFIMIPLPIVIMEKITVPLKIIVTKLSVMILHVLNISYFVKGYEIEMPTGNLIIDNPCSGLRSFVAFLSLSLLIAYIEKIKKLRVIIFLICTIPIAVLCNILRVQTLLLVSYYFGIRYSRPGGFVHDWSGFIMFIVGTIIFLALARGIKKEF